MDRFEGPKTCARTTESHTMPLLIVCGHPCTGKTKVAETIATALRSRGAAVELLNEETLGIDRSTTYACELSSHAHTITRTGIENPVLALGCFSYRSNNERKGSQR